MRISLMTSLCLIALVCMYVLCPMSYVLCVYACTYKCMYVRTHA